jgi:hypothetical protein
MYIYKTSKGDMNQETGINSKAKELYLILVSSSVSLGVQP